MTKISLTESSERIKVVKKILEEHPDGIFQREITRLTNIKPSSLSHIVHEFLYGKVQFTNSGRTKLIRLLDSTPSYREKKLITRTMALKRARELREGGFSYSEIVHKLKEELGSAVSFETLHSMKMSKSGELRYREKLHLDRYKAGVKGGRIQVTTGHIYSIRALANPVIRRKAMLRIPETSKELSLKKTRILAHSLFDGFIVDIERKYHGQHVVGYCNTSKILINQFIDDVKGVYTLKPTDVRERERANIVVRYCSIAIVKDLERYLTFTNSWEVFSEDFVENTSNSWKTVFLRAFWDDEGTVRFNQLTDRRGYIRTHRKVEAYQKNTGLLYQLKEMHEQLGIKAYINKNKLIISDRANLTKFRDLIHFTDGVVSCKTTSKWYGVEKNKILRLAVESYGK